MSIATLQNIEKTFGKRVLFDQLNFNVERGERIGLIGANGAGKTTLFKLLTGQVMADVGVVRCREGDEDRPSHAGSGLRAGRTTVLDEAELAFAELHAAFASTARARA